MVTILLSWCFVFFYASKLRLTKRTAFWFVLLTTWLLAFFSYAEVLLVSPEDIYSRLDEQYFADIAGLEFQELIKEGERYRLFHLYNFLTLNSWFGWNWALKVHLIAFPILIALVLFDFVKNIYVIWFFPIVFSYVILLGTLNMRDVILIFITLYSVLYLSRANSSLKRILWVGLPFGLMSFIRPEAAFLYLFLGIWIGFFTIWIRRPTFAFYIPAALIFGLVIFQTNLEQLAMYLQQLTPLNIYPYLEARAEELQQLPFLGENMTAVIRQLVTPLPTSKLNQIATGGMSEAFYIYEISRSLMMAIVYGLALYAVFNWQYLGAVFRINRSLGALLLISILHTAAYSVYSDGGGDSRNKLYPFFLLFLLYFEIIVAKKESFLRKFR